MRLVTCRHCRAHISERSNTNVCGDCEELRPPEIDADLQQESDERDAFNERLDNLRNEW